LAGTVTREQVYEVLKETLIEQGTEPEAITPEATFEDLEVDSLDLVELAQVVEERFGVTIKGSEVAKIANLGEAAAWIAERA